MKNHGRNAPEAVQSSSDREVVRQRAAVLLALHGNTLKPGVTACVLNTDRYGEQQYAIYRDDCLYWRAWTYEPGFLADLERYLSEMQK
jgi:hypothetical protein